MNSERSAVKTIIERLHSRWSESGVRLRSGVSELELQRFETNNRVVLPEDFRTFFLTIDGMKDGEMDPASMIRFWSLEEVRPVVEEIRGEESCVLDYEGFFLFADYSLWAHGYAIRLGENRCDVNPVVIVGGDVPIHVATSFAHFLEKYCQDPKDVLS